MRKEVRRASESFLATPWMTIEIVIATLVWVLGAFFLRPQSLRHDSAMLVETVIFGEVGKAVFHGCLDISKSVSYVLKYMTGELTRIVGLSKLVH